ncbi:branched-chain amino acid ABC transporter permease [Pseudogracilibacillus auburnensis]|uniref:Amino acid/amide ABC transporter membrane protein 2 (HAAT family) n=1 Tax=Pseudogracilibacillus auburnensis TaxID=1494959 RepID=A0A2V3WE87_9BACI|nr:branched-chain amino acid ABC transporter permease [Pseudogracilibacillus auburnensis]PXW87129.1 amino acid/amide ABC transporter membrane protein 2 (HAAT family) [Pseudogracilibacillus auburnensis]
MKKMKELGYSKMGLIIGGIVLFFLPFLITNPYFIYVVNLILIYIILTLGLDLLVGYTGQVSLGHAGLFGIGAYSTALFSTKLDYSFWVTLPLATIITTMIGFVVGFIGLKLVEEYLVMATLAFGTILWLVFLNWSDLTGGPMGVSAIPAPPTIRIGSILEYGFNKYIDYYPLFVAFVLLSIFVTRLIIRSGFGRACTAIRDDELAAQAMGIPVFKTKVVMFTISSAYCGVAGALYAHFLHVVSPETFAFAMSVTILTMVMIGGQGSIIGAILGATLLTVTSEALRSTPELRMMIYGLLIILVMMFFPRGIMGLMHLFKEKFIKNKTVNTVVNSEVKKEGLRYE